MKNINFELIDYVYVERTFCLFSQVVFLLFNDLRAFVLSPPDNFLFVPPTDDCRDE